MTFRKKFLSSFAAAAMLLGMTAGMTSALDLDYGEGTAELNVVCPAATNVSAAFGPAFNINLGAGTGTYDSDSSTVAITVDLTCNNELAWGVTTSISDFNRTGFVPTGKTNTFDGSTFKMTGGSLTEWVPGPTASSNDDGPEVNSTVIPDSGLGSIAMADAFIFDFPSTSSPGISTGTWNTQLKEVPNNIWTGEYTAKFTVTLYTP